MSSVAFSCSSTCHYLRFIFASQEEASTRQTDEAVLFGETKAIEYKLDAVARESEAPLSHFAFQG